MDSRPALLSRIQDDPSSLLLGTTAVAYICGWCSRENEFKPTDELRCIKCGYRIFYKKKLREGMQYEAR